MVTWKKDGKGYSFFKIACKKNLTENKTLDIFITQKYTQFIYVLFN